MSELERAREIVGSAERIVVLTGAGLSAESGAPTFRDAGGLGKSHRPEELATPEATPLTSLATVSLRGPAGELVPVLMQY